MNADFERNIKDPNLSVTIDLSHKDMPVLIAFGGIGGALAIPPYEFFNLTHNLDVNKIYMRDLSQTWYHSGLPGISKNIDETAFFLRRKIGESDTNKVVVLGNSMGGYAAILFGLLIKADIVHAFSPHTFIHVSDYIRYKQQIQYVHNNFSSKYFDLKDVIQAHNNTGEFNLYYDSTNRLDKKHVMHLKGERNVVLHAFRGGGHALVRTMRDSGELQKIIKWSLTDTSNESISADSKKHRSFLAKLFGAGCGKRSA